jgi:hypothetical protein
MSKVADVFGCLESFSLAIFLYTIGYIQQAASNNVKTFASAQIFYSAGSQGLQILQQVFAADTTDLLNRALFSTLLMFHSCGLCGQVRQLPKEYYQIGDGDTGSGPSFFQYAPFLSFSHCS